MVQHRAVGDADGREELGVFDEEQERLSVRKLIDGERMPPDDAVTGIAADEEE
jgi:hypothetical protein